MLKIRCGVGMALSLLSLLLVSTQAYALVGAGPKSIGQIKQTFPSPDAASGHNCAINSSDNLVCWGGVDPAAFVPGSLGKVKQFAAGSDGFCAIGLDNLVKCWGSSASATPPVDLGAASQIALAENIACAIKQSNSNLVCWGTYQDSEDNRQSAQGLSGLGAVKAIAMGGQLGCAIKQSDSKIRCWKWSGVEVSMPSDLAAASQVAMGTVGADIDYPEVCIITAPAGGIQCLSGVPGDSSNSMGWQADSLPTDVYLKKGKGVTIKQITLGQGYGCFIYIPNSGGLADCWAQDSLDDREVINAPSYKGVTSIAAGSDYACGIISSKTLFCWGDNQRGDINALPTSTSGSNEIMKGEAAKTFTTEVANWGWSNNPTGFTYQWQRSKDGATAWANIPRATSISYTALASDKFIRLCIVATNPNGSTPLCSETRGAPIPDFELTLIGSTAGIQMNNSDTADSLSYQWERYNVVKKTWTVIAGANKNTYAITPADKNSFVRVGVQGVNVLGTGARTYGQSLGAPAVDPRQLIGDEVEPSSQGPKEQAGKLVLDLSSTNFYFAFSDTDWSPMGSLYKLSDITVHYQWQRSADGKAGWAKVGTDANSYTPVGSDQNKYLRVCITATNIVGTSAWQCFANIQGPPALSDDSTSDQIVPTGKLFSVGSDDLSWDDWSSGNIDGTPTSVSYQWQSAPTYGGVYANIAGAITDQWTATDEQKGKIYVRLCLTASKTLGSKHYCLLPYGVPYRTKFPTLVVSGAAWSLPVTTDDSDWAVSPDIISYQWQRSTAPAGVWSNIPLADRSSYSTVAADRGKYLRICLSPSNEWGAGTQFCTPARKA